LGLKELGVGMLDQNKWAKSPVTAMSFDETRFDVFLFGFVKSSGKWFKLHGESILHDVAYYFIIHFEISIAALLIPVHEGSNVSSNT